MEELAKYFKDLPMLDPKGPDNIDLVSKLKTFFPSSLISMQNMVGRFYPVSFLVLLGFSG
jgi:hypothetical protein